MTVREGCAWGLGVGLRSGFGGVPLGGVELFDAVVGATSFLGCFFGEATSPASCGRAA